jgi:alkanesulfonate monooxygenase SsuD/methylene tetrahydromethanopterin reductase-like flavin-dependent oxidoreductase (luciferase family)
MEFGMFHEFQRLPGASDAAAFADSFAQVDAAERMGLDAMWLAELHFNPERSVLASPLILAAAIAARTTRMKIGTAVQVLPLCHPLRLAEEIATIDHLANGRLIFGVGRSGFAHTYRTYGVDYGESRERFAETLEIVKGCFTEERFSHKGKYFTYDNVRLSPRPLQQPWPEIRIAAASPDTYEEAAAMGHAIFVAARTGNLSELAPLVKTYRAAVEAGGATRGRARSTCACRSMSRRPRRRRAKSRARASSICCAPSAAGSPRPPTSPAPAPSRSAASAPPRCSRSSTTRC